MTIRAGLAFALLAAVPGREARAAPIPLTALSQSLQVRSELLLQDEASQYLFPQLAAGAPSALFGFGASSEQSVAGSGVRAGLDGSSLSFLFLDSVPFATAAGEDAPVYQVGVARRTGGLRIGGAYAWSVLGDRLRRAVTNGEAERTSSEFLNVVHHEASFGLGWGDGTASIDLVAEVRWERLHDRVQEATESSTGSTGALRAYDVTVDGDLMPGIATRARVPLGSRLRLVGFGSYRELSFDAVRTTRVETTNSGGVSVEKTSETLHDHGQSWSAGASLEVGEQSQLALHGFWESTREPARHDPGAASQRWARTKVEELRIGVSGAHELRRATTLHAGWSMTDRRDHEVQETIYFFETYVDAHHGRTVSHDFGWGATHTFWLIDLTGSASVDVSLGDLFFLLDLRARF